MSIYTVLLGVCGFIDSGESFFSYLISIFSHIGRSLYFDVKSSQRYEEDCDYHEGDCQYHLKKYVGLSKEADSFDHANRTTKGTVLNTTRSNANFHKGMAKLFGVLDGVPESELPSIEHYSGGKPNDYTGPQQDNINLQRRTKMKGESKTITQFCAEPHLVSTFNGKVETALAAGWIPSGQVIVIDEYEAGREHAFGSKKGARTYIQHFYRLM